MGGRPQRDEDHRSLVILVDTSVWVEYLRNTGSNSHIRLRLLITTEAELAITDAVRLEVLAGARDDIHERRLRRLLARAVILPTSPAHYDHAASVYRSCRKRGETIRKLLDCLIAAVAIQSGVPVLHADGDFDVMARHTDLEIVSLS